MKNKKNYKELHVNIQQLITARELEDLERVCKFTPNTQDSNDVFLRLGKIELLKYIKAILEENDE